MPDDIEVYDRFEFKNFTFFIEKKHSEYHIYLNRDGKMTLTRGNIHSLLESYKEILRQLTSLN